MNVYKKNKHEFNRVVTGPIGEVKPKTRETCVRIISDERTKDHTSE